MTVEDEPTPFEGVGARSVVELYRGVGGKRSWKVRVVPVDETPDAIREAVSLALELEAQVADGLRDRYAKAGL